MLVSSIYPPDLREYVIDVKYIGQLLPRPTFGDTGSNMSTCFLVGFLFFFPRYMPL